METETETPDEAAVADRSARHIHFQHIRFADLDPLNHVNNVQMLTYLEDARISFLHWNSQVDGESQLGPLVVGRHEVDYLLPLVLRPEPVRVETWVTGIRNASFQLAHEIRDEEAVYMRAASTLVGFDMEGQRSRRLGAAERRYLSGYLVEPS
nr:thioesterase family protein [Haloactinospora alba]